MILRSLSQKTNHTLPPRSLIGRTHRCDLSIPASWVSGEHAAVRWSGQRWEVRDLGSRNGTRLNERALDVGTWVTLEEGDVLVFGLPDTTFRVIDATPPALFAISLADERIVLAEGGLLVLPDADDPEVMVFQGPSGAWVMESTAETRALLPDAVLSVGGVPYRVHLPEDAATTTEARAETHMADLSLRFSVSPDEEYVNIVAVGPHGEIDLKSRVHHYMLLTLARIRLRETADGISDAEAGWVYIEDLVRMLRLDLSKINMAVFRARRQLAAAGIDGAALLVERRPSTRQLRLGCGRLDVRTL